jgi:hypothetical protein
VLGKEASIFLVGVFLFDRMFKRSILYLGGRYCKGKMQKLK